MNSTLNSSNVSNVERTGRLVLSAALIGAVITAPETTPVWVALVALYPAFTALMAWDPIYAMASKMAATGSKTPVRINTQNPHAMNRGR